ncbi:MAG: ferrochelatase [Pseudohongiellaceae bacterium]
MEAPLRKAVLILNLGTPAEPTTKGLREFYRYFFADPFVFDLPAWGRWMLRNLIIIPFRAPKTAKQYQTIWLEGGSPLKVYSDRLLKSLQQAFHKDGVLVRAGMGYSQPFIAETMEELEKAGVNEIVVIPLFPQYSTATTKSVFHAVNKCLERWHVQPRIKFVPDLFSEPAFIRAWATLITRHLPLGSNTPEIEHVIFSYHGLPERNISRADEHNYCRFGVCCATINDSNRYCYRAQCMETTRSIVSALGWPDEFYSVAFQSRFGKQAWIQPYLDEHISQLAERGIRNIAVVTPSFVSDCLETLHEIGIEYREMFIEKGGEELMLVPNLNDDVAWFSAMREIVSKHLAD